MKHPEHLKKLGYWSNRVAADFRAAVDKRMQEFGLRAPQGMILGILNSSGPFSLADLAKELENAHPSVLRHIDLLEEMGYVERKQHEEDRRIKLVAITQAGRELVPDLFKILHDVNDEALQGINKQEQDTVLRVLTTIHKNLGGSDCHDLDHEMVEHVMAHKHA